MASPNDAAGTTKSTPRPIAFYLPQFHPVPENDVFWGEGFTEWGNVVRAKPLFPGHYQPRIPADLGFYDLRLPEVRQAQADLAREHGLYGFCYYHYWFNGRRVLERPFEEVLKSGHPDFPFCLCWANHNWTWRRENRDMGRLMAQEYSEEDNLKHIRWLLEVFQDERYIKVNHRPLLLIYMVQDIPDAQSTLAMWREEARNAGVADPYICKVESVGNWRDPQDFGCDASVEFWPHGMDRIVENVHTLEEVGRVNQITEYRDLVEQHIKREAAPFRRYPCVVPQWDNTARFKPVGSRIIHNSTPELYERWLRGVIEKVSANPPDEQLIFINAWNEWGEGAYLEPDYRYGRAYLEATRRALETSGVRIPTAPRALTAVEGDDTAVEVPTTTSIEQLYAQLLQKYTLLQRRLVEQFSTEEHLPLVQKAERRAQDLTQENDQLKNQVRSLKADRDRLARWMQEVDNGITVLLNSRRWKLSEAVFETGRRVLGRPRVPTAQDHLVKVTDAFRERNKEISRLESGEDDSANGRS